MTKRNAVLIVTWALTLWVVWLAAMFWAGRHWPARADSVQLERSCICDEWRTLEP